MKDEWIKSVYRSGKDSEDVIPESIDTSILEQARLAHDHPSQSKSVTSRVQPYGWIYGTAASAILGIMLILQIPETTDLPSLLTKVERVQADSSEFIAISQEEASLELESKPEAEASSDTMAPLTDSVDKVPAYARRAIPKSLGSPSDNFSEKARAPKKKLLKQTPENAPGLLILPVPGESFSTLAESKLLTNCTRFKAHFMHAVKKHVIIQCERATQLSFQFEDKTATTCNEIYRFTLGSAAIVSTRKLKSDSGLEKIQIEHAGDLYSLRCETGQWVLTPENSLELQP